MLSVSPSTGDPELRFLDVLSEAEVENISAVTTVVLVSYIKPVARTVKASMCRVRSELVMSG